ncbi:MAG: SagB/ThcOx family dehydrogenase [Armatimonadetes bacterium]|nr:SagB/ThcOx family dehydrogenase [Armatimonadota bacterium]
MDNRNVGAAWEYHKVTKHSYQSIRSGAHALDWANQPVSFKIYTTLPPIPLPKDLVEVPVPALEAVSAPWDGPPGDTVPDLRTLATVLHLSAGVTRFLTVAGQQMPFRAAACTGALYHIELYVACGDVPDLPAGIYHYSVHDHALRRLRTGDYRGMLARAAAEEPAVRAAPVMLIATSTYWRNAWKYRARAYRHCFWDSGTILANTLAASAAHRLPARAVCGFVDGAVNRLLDVNPEREAALVLVPLGRTAEAPQAPPDDAPPLGLPTMALSATEVDYPAIRAIHAASSLAAEAEVAVWRDRTPTTAQPAPAGRLFPLRPSTGEGIPSDSLARVIHRRGSSRRFAREPITFEHLSTILASATRGVPADFLDPPGVALNHLYLIVHAVDGLPSGTYVFHRDRQALELLRAGDFRREAGYLGLEQALPADASANVYMLADLDACLARFGNRGYRAAMLEAGVIGGKMYLAAYALRLGATGLTFYDDDVTAFFSPHAQGKSVIFLVALGRPRRRSTRPSRR